MTVHPLFVTVPQAAPMTQELSETDVFVLLAKRRRRLILETLRESSTPLRTIELAERVGSHENEALSVEDLRAVYLDLAHNHLPGLHDADVVLYDREDGTVRPGPNFDALVRVLDDVTERDEPWSSD